MMPTSFGVARRLLALACALLLVGLVAGCDKPAVPPRAIEGLWAVTRVEVAGVERPVPTGSQPYVFVRWDPPGQGRPPGSPNTGAWRIGFGGGCNNGGGTVEFTGPGTMEISDWVSTAMLCGGSLDELDKLLTPMRLTEHYRLRGDTLQMWSDAGFRLELRSIAAVPATQGPGVPIAPTTTTTAGR